jgi:hypothetical protein
LRYFFPAKPLHLLLTALLFGVILTNLRAQYQFWMMQGNSLFQFSQDCCKITVDAMTFRSMCRSARGWEEGCSVKKGTNHQGILAVLQSRNQVLALKLSLAVQIDHG